MPILMALGLDLDFFVLDIHTPTFALAARTSHVQNRCAALINIYRFGFPLAVAIA
jgi:hypothetical protein